MVEEIFLQALLVTVLVETACLLLLLKYLPTNKRKYARIKPLHILAAGAIPSALTLPYLWFIVPTFLDSSYSIWVGEAIVVIVEAFLLDYLLNLKKQGAFLFSFVCNIASFAVGLIVF